MFVTPGSFTPPGRVMLQSSSARTRLAASHKVAGSTSKVGKRIVAIADSSKRVGHNRPKGWATIGFYFSPVVWKFLGRTEEFPRKRCKFLSSWRPPLAQRDCH